MSGLVYARTKVVDVFDVSIRSFYDRPQVVLGGFQQDQVFGSSLLKAIFAKISFVVANLPLGDFRCFFKSCYQRPDGKFCRQANAKFEFAKVASFQDFGNNRQCSDCACKFSSTGITITFDFFYGVQDVNATFDSRLFCCLGKCHVRPHRNAKIDALIVCSCSNLPVQIINRGYGRYHCSPAAKGGQPIPEAALLALRTGHGLKAGKLQHGIDENATDQREGYQPAELVAEMVLRFLHAEISPLIARFKVGAQALSFQWGIA